MPAAKLSGIIKSFNKVQVLHGVDFELRKGEVHALLGGNGAGKSTLMKIMEGAYAPDGGSIEIDGQVVDTRAMRSSQGFGVAMIFQEFSLVPTLSVAENIFLTREPRTRFGLIDDHAVERKAAEILDEMGVDIDPRAIVGKLSTGAWQLTEIAKALSRDARILIMDEPTASLTSTETEALFGIIQKLKDRGISIIYISHRMDEIFLVADRVTVLRDGRNIATREVSDVSMEELIEMIVGKQVEHAFVWHARQVDRTVPPLLQVEALTAHPRVRDVSLELYPGEILGIAGLMGSGRTELARALFGIDPIANGRILIGGKPARLRNPRDAIMAGISLIPEDRRVHGLVLDHSVRNNLILTLLDSLAYRGFLDDKEADARSRELVERLDIRTDSIHKRAKLLSGGNQQKVVLAKWLATGPQILIMDEPTAGVDIGAKGDIIAMIRTLASSGMGILVISSELPELLATSDRIAIMRAGSIERVIARSDVQDEEHLQGILHRGKVAA